MGGRVWSSENNDPSADPLVVNRQTQRTLQSDRPGKKGTTGEEGDSPSPNLRGPPLPPMIAVKAAREIAGKGNQLGH